ncbi:MAG TPA: DUF2799 domain-containing protein [Paracoccaceae bacterium]|nr:DUF2799 domain-containing protein [Paracoccaceae bacterium]
MRILLLLAALFALPGCEPERAPQASAETCRPENWQRLGYAAGLAGEPRESLSALITACAPYGPANETAWGIGYDRGLAEYCTPENAYRLGRLEEPVRAVCPADKKEAFDKAYAEGERDSWTSPPPRTYYAYPYPYPYPYYSLGFSYYYYPRYAYPPYYVPRYHFRPAPPPRSTVRPPDWPRR